MAAILQTTTEINFHEKSRALIQFLQMFLMDQLTTT